MLVNVVAPVLVVAACWGIYRLSPPVDRAESRGGVAVRLSGSSEAVAWQPRRRYLVARVLRTPVRHLASVIHHRDVFQAGCVCGWHGAWHAHQGDAFAEAHVHTHYINAAVRSTNEADGEATPTISPAHTHPVEKVVP
jgi:hypothetical protein